MQPVPSKLSRSTSPFYGIKILTCAVVAILLCTASSYSQSCSPGSGWGLSGYAGDIYSGPGGDPNWQHYLAQLEATNGGAPSCSYTFILDNPTTGYGHYSGNCSAQTYTCTGAPGPCPTNAPSLPCPECESKAHKPVNLTNGNVWVAQQDYSLPGIGGGISLERTWNSLWATYRDVMPQVGMFGDSWRGTYEERLFSYGSNFIKYYRSNGDGWLFQWNSSTNNYQILTPANRHATLVYNGTTLQYTITFSDGTQRVFDSNGYLISLIDRNNNQTSLTYDASKRITTITDAASRTLTFTYGNSTFPSVATAATDSTGTVANYTYDSNGRLTNVTYPDTSQLNFVYDSNALLTSVTDAQAKVIESHTYDSSRRGLVSQSANGVDAVTVAYTSSGTTTLTDSLSHTTTYNYSPFVLANLITSVSGPTCNTCGAANTVSFANDLNGNRLSSTDANGNVTNFTYDSQSNVLTRSNTVGSNNLTWTYTYNSFGEVLTAADPLNHTTTNTYDAKGNLLTTTTPSPDGIIAGSVTTFTYDTKGQLLTVKDPRNNTTTIAYTAAGLISTITDAQSKVTTYTYDARGNRLTVKDALNNTTSFTYDSMNRLTKITYPPVYPTSPTNLFAYDTRGRRTSVTDGDGKVTTYAYDDADRLTTVTDAASHATNCAYDTESNLTSITDANSNATSFTYNANRWVTRTTFPSTLTENYSYDLNGNLTGKTDRKNQLITYTYDQLNRLTQKSYPDSTNVTYTYDNASRLTQVVDPTGTYSFTFDNMGRLTGTTTAYSFLTGRNFTTSYAYDAASNRTSFTDPESAVTSYAYDTLNRLQTLTQPPAFSSSGNLGFAYDALSRRTQMTRPNGVASNYSYDSLSRLLSVFHQKGTQTVDGTGYGVDLAGNRINFAPFGFPGGGSIRFTYDSAYQLLGASAFGSYPGESFTYDSVGNRLSSVGTASYTYNSSNQLTATSSATYAYDNDGNTTSKTASSNTTGYAWDFENRLTSVTLPGSGGTVTFKYDPFGRRIYKSSSSGTSVFAYDGDNLIEETSSTGTVVARYVHGLNIDEPLAMLRSSATSYYQADGLGSITSLSNSSGSITNTYSYNSFGSLLSSTGSVVNPFRFTARESDSESGLYFYRARYYDTSIGRFLSEDPTAVDGGMNLFAYTDNNPIKWTDPFGLAPRLPRCPKQTIHLTRADLERAIGPLTAADNSKLDDGCIGMCKLFQNVPTDYPENAPGTKCFKTLPQAQARQCPKGQQSFIFGKDGSYKIGESAPTPGPGGEVPTGTISNLGNAYFNYITVFPGGCFGGMNHDSNTPGQLAYLTPTPPPLQQGWHRIWCTTCKCK